MAGDPVTSIATARRSTLGPMDQEDVRQRLAEEHDRLEEIRAGFAAEHLRDESEDDSMSELSHLAQHSADVATETFEREKDFSILEQVEAELADVERALRRIDDGRYGKCEACGAEIGDDRLDAMPATRFCITHQTQAEADAAS
jgi:RNA polymerase-binding transcription factor DksA